MNLSIPPCPPFKTSTAAQGRFQPSIFKASQRAESNGSRLTAFSNVRISPCQIPNMNPPESFRLAPQFKTRTFFSFILGEWEVGQISARTDANLRGWRRDFHSIRVTDWLGGTNYWFSTIPEGAAMGSRYGTTGSRLRHTTGDRVENNETSQSL
jgi:hypothetical protein